MVRDLWGPTSYLLSQFISWGLWCSRIAPLRARDAKLMVSLQLTLLLAPKYFGLRDPWVPCCWVSALPNLASSAGLSLPVPHLGLPTFHPLVHQLVPHFVLWILGSSTFTPLGAHTAHPLVSSPALALPAPQLDFSTSLALDFPPLFFGP